MSITPDEDLEPAWVALMNSNSVKAAILIFLSQQFIISFRRQSGKTAQAKPVTIKLLHLIIRI